MRTGEIDLLLEAESCFRRAQELGVPARDARSDLLALAAAYRTLGLESDATRLEQLLLFGGRRLLHFSPN